MMGAKLRCKYCTKSRTIMIKLPLFKAKDNNRSELIGPIVRPPTTYQFSVTFKWSFCVGTTNGNFCHIVKRSLSFCKHLKHDQSLRAYIVIYLLLSLQLQTDVWYISHIRPITCRKSKVFGRHNMFTWIIGNLTDLPHNWGDLQLRFIPALEHSLT